MLCTVLQQCHRLCKPLHSHPVHKAPLLTNRFPQTFHSHLHRNLPRTTATSWTVPLIQTRQGWQENQSQLLFASTHEGIRLSGRSQMKGHGHVLFTPMLTALHSRCLLQALRIGAMCRQRSQHTAWVASSCFVSKFAEKNSYTAPGRQRVHLRSCTACQQQHLAAGCCALQWQFLSSDILVP